MWRVKAFPCRAKAPVKIRNCWKKGWFDADGGAFTLHALRSTPLGECAGFFTHVCVCSRKYISPARWDFINPIRWKPHNVDDAQSISAEQGFAPEQEDVSQCCAQVTQSGHRKCCQLFALLFAVGALRFPMPKQIRLQAGGKRRLLLVGWLGAFPFWRPAKIKGAVCSTHYIYTRGI